MATTTLGVAVSDTTNVSTYTSGAFTPAVGDLLIVLVSGRTQTTTPTVSASANGVTTFSSAAAILQDAGGSRLSIHVADALTTGTASMTVSIAYGSATQACVGAVLRVSGMTRTGAAAVRQSAGADNNLAASGTPAVTFAGVCLTANTVLGIVGNNTSPATLTQPTGFTELVDNGQSTPTSGSEVVSKDTGFTSATVTWGGTSATRGAAAAIELDVSAAGTPVSLTGAVAGLTTGAPAGTVSAPTSLTGAVAAVTIGAPAGTVSAGSSTPASLTGAVAGLSIAAPPGTVSTVAAVGPQIQLDDGTGTFPYDVTSFVRMVEGYAWTRGRPDELQAIQPGPLTLTFDNTDGRFTFGNVTYNVAPDQKIRVTVNGTVRWTGRVQSWPVSWPGGDDTFSTVLATAIDPLATMSRRTLASSYIEETSADSPIGSYPVGEASGATQASDISGNNQPALVAKPGDGTITFGTALNTVDGATGAKFTGVNWSGGQTSGYLTAPGGTWTSPSLSFDLAFVASGLTNAGGSAVLARIGAAPVSGPVAWATVTLDPNASGGGLHVIAPNGNDLVVGSFLNLADGLPHRMSFQHDATGTQLWVDDALDRTGTAGNAANVTSWNNANLRLGSSIGDLYTGATLTLGEFNYGPRLSDARVLQHQAAMVNDFTGEAPAARVTRVAGYAGVPVGILDTAGDTLCGPAAQVGKSALDVCNEVAEATLGIVYADKNGAISSVAGYTIAATVTPALTIDANFAAEDTAAQVDMAQVVNKGTGKAASSANVATFLNAASIGSPGNHDVYPADYSWNVSTDAQALDLLTWAINNYANPAARFPTIVLDLATLDAPTVAAALTLDLGGFVRITGLPSQTPGGASVDLIVQSLTETVTKSDWTLTLTCAKRTRFSAWVLGDATYGVLGSTTRLYV